jgi:hypothetical protein
MRSALLKDVSRNWFVPVKQSSRQSRRVERVPALKVKDRSARRDAMQFSHGGVLEKIPRRHETPHPVSCEPLQRANESVRDI